LSVLTSKPAAFLSAAIGSGAERPSDSASERILDAALELSAASGIRNLTVDDVARRAGVGRMTVYRRFGDKAKLLEALAVREGRRCLAELDAVSPADASLLDLVTEGFVASLRIAREHPLLNRLARHEPQAVLEALLADDSAIFRMGRAFAAARLRAAPDGASLSQAQAEHAAELLVRLAFSFVLLQDSVLPLDDERRARDVARRLLAPIVGA
jgi:AcrR family transcriptional regulator